MRTSRTSTTVHGRAKWSSRTRNIVRWNEQQETVGHDVSAPSSQGRAPREARPGSPPRSRLMHKTPSTSAAHKARAWHRGVHLLTWRMPSSSTRDCLPKPSSTRHSKSPQFSCDTSPTPPLDPPSVREAHSRRRNPTYLDTWELGCRHRPCTQGPHIRAQFHGEREQ